MKLAALALDFDGTIAVADRLDPAVRSALAEARSRKVAVLLVTGRRLDDLRRVAGDLHFVDAVVAENGAVLYVPTSGFTATLAAPPSRELLADMTALGIAHAAGQCLVEAESDDSPAILRIIRNRELPVCLLFNRSRVMVLPQSVSKGTGLREALAMLRLSPLSAVAIGDAENDHEMLRICELGAAVRWGSPALAAFADVVIEGDGPPAVAAYIRGLLDGLRIPVPARPRRQLLVGHLDDGSPFNLAVRGRNVLVAGDARSGKSWVAGLLAEQLILQRYCVCVIDPEGDYRPLETLPGVTRLGGANPLPRPRELLAALHNTETSVVIDLSHVTHQQKVDYVAALLPALRALRRHTGLPHRVVMDEAHYFLPGCGHEAAAAIAAGGYTLATYRASHLPAEILGTAEVVMVTCESDPVEVSALHALSRAADPLETWIETLGSLAIGEAAALPVTEESGHALRRVHLSPRLTQHVRHREKYVDIPVPDAHTFSFTRDGRATGRHARTLRELVRGLEEEQAAVLEGHVRRSDFSRWVADVFGDYALAAAIRNLEQRCCREHYPDAPAAIADAIRGRYDLADEIALAADPGDAGEARPVAVVAAA